MASIQRWSTSHKTRISGECVSRRVCLDQLQEGFVVRVGLQDICGHHTHMVIALALAGILYLLRCDWQVVVNPHQLDRACETDGDHRDPRHAAANHRQQENHDRPIGNQQLQAREVADTHPPPVNRKQRKHCSRDGDQSSDVDQGGIGRNDRCAREKIFHLIFIGLAEGVARNVDRFMNNMVREMQLHSESERPS